MFETRNRGAPQKKKASVESRIGLVTASPPLLATCALNLMLWVRSHEGLIWAHDGRTYFPWTGLLRFNFLLVPPNLLPSLFLSNSSPSPSVLYLETSLDT